MSLAFAMFRFQISGPVVALGVMTGMLYGILGVGLVLVYRSSRMINFAYGDIGAFGAAVLAVASIKWGLPYWVAFILALGAAAVVGGASEVLIIRRLQNAPIVIGVVATLGLGQILEAFSAILTTNSNGTVLGVGGVSYPQPAGFPQFNIGALLMTKSYTAMLVLTPALVVALGAFLRRGRLGIALRASAANPEAARMSGMLAGRLSSLAWAIAGGVAAYTAMLVEPTRGFSSGEFLGPDLLLRALACAVVARMVSLPIALVAGIGLGVVEQLLLANYPNGGLVEVVIFLIILAVLVVQRSVGGRSEQRGTWSAVQAFSTLPRSMASLPSVRRLGWVVAAVLLAICIAIPELTTNTNAGYFTYIAVFGITGLSLMVITGLGGQLSLGQFAVAGVGAAGWYLTVHHGAPYLVGVLVAAAAGAAISLVIGLPALRIKGLMLAVATLGFGLAAEEWLFEQQWVFGGGANTPRPALPGFSFDTQKRYYFISVAFLLVALWITRAVWRGGIGRRLRAVRDNEDAARSFGVPATAVKLQAFILAGVLAGLAGALYGGYNAQLSNINFPIVHSINVAAATALGGLGLLAGPLLGAFYLFGLPQFVSFGNVELLASNAGWLILLLIFPGGLGQSFGSARDRLVDWLARREGLDPVRERAITPGGGVGTSGRGLVLPPPGARSVPHGQPLLEVTGLTKRFGGLVAVHDVSLEVRAGEILGLIGPNGAGKTTLFEMLGGFTRPDGGTIRFQGQGIDKLPAEGRAGLGLIRSFQDAALFPTLTVHEVVMVAFERSAPTPFVRASLGLAGAIDNLKAERADQLLETLGLASYRDTKVMNLSTGTRRITELACLIAVEPVLLLLDEPTSGIAQRETEALGAVLRRIKTELDLTLVIIEHDIPLIMGLADRVVAMESGGVLLVGSPAEVQADERVIESYLGTDTITIERSTRARHGREASGFGHQLEGQCGVPTRAGTPCARRAGPDGVCAQHRKVTARR
jgi:ABC-type branched-subunit amino acid transport system ATPase component/ABC-type branched-subunit amino acid transport system permease subunit